MLSPESLLGHPAVRLTRRPDVRTAKNRFALVPVVAAPWIRFSTCPWVARGTVALRRGRTLPSSAGSKKYPVCNVRVQTCV